jgi:hypothetical protein
MAILKCVVSHLQCAEPPPNPPILGDFQTIQSPPELGDLGGGFPVIQTNFLYVGCTKFSAPFTTLAEIILSPCFSSRNKSLFSVT